MNLVRPQTPVCNGSSICRIPYLTPPPISACLFLNDQMPHAPYLIHLQSFPYPYNSLQCVTHSGIVHIDSHNTLTHTEKDTQTERQRQKHRQTQKLRNPDTDRHTNTHTEGQKHGHTDRHTHRQTDIDTETHPYRQRHPPNQKHTRPHSVHITIR